MASSVLRNEGVKSAIGTVKDKVTAAKISVSSPEGLKILDLSVRKATSHDDVVPKEKHVRSLKQVMPWHLSAANIYHPSKPS
mmetsp:Transcript_12624/g.35502  ORF Transcript_12624/g.35502 Transcript_12624/m.35502 type:complete len:82 (+) Transcript_12624:158-403(+)